MSDDRFELPYEDVPGGAFQADLGAEYPLSDTVDIAAAFFEAPGGLLVPFLRLGFHVGIPGQSPRFVAGTAFVGDEQSLSSFERLGVARARLDRGHRAN
jgi:hypothetical protein